MRECVKMQKSKSPVRYIIYFIIIVLAIIASISLYKNSKNKLLDKTSFRDFKTDIVTASEGFTSNEDMFAYLKKWADDNKLNYEVDDSNNIIFTSDAISGKEDVSPTIIATSYDYLTTETDASSLSTAAAVASSNIDAGKYTVIFFNNDANSGIGYKNINSKYFSDDAKVIYLDYGDKGYLSDKSFANATSTIQVPYSTQSVTSDTTLKLRIGGVSPENITSTISSQPNPITAFGTVLSRMKNKHYTYQISNINVVANSNMYSSSIEVTITMDSYSVEAFTEWLNDKSQSYIDKYSDDFPDIYYEYEMVDNSTDVPTEALSDEAVDYLNTLIYTIKNGTYTFDKGEAPDGSEDGDSYAINCIDNLTEQDGILSLEVSTSALTKTYLDKVLDENATAADLVGSSATVSNKNDDWSNTDSKLAQNLAFTYQKVNDVSFMDFIQEDKTDAFFTPCSYLNAKNSNMDIVHMRLSEDTEKLYANTVLCYINDKGNILSI